MALCVECGTMSDARALRKPTVARAMEGKFLSVTSAKKENQGWYYSVLLRELAFNYQTVVYEPRLRI